jgi:thioredoxin-dependent peroxiredoxin
MSSAKQLHTQLAPDFSANDIFGQTIQLSAYRGSPVLLSFFRNSACALCNLRVHQLIQRYSAYHAAGLEVLAVFESPVESIRQYVGKQDAPFPIIANPLGELYTLYGVEVSEEKVNATITSIEGKERIQEAAEAGYQLVREAGSNFYRIPADFLIDADGRIHTALYTDWIGQHLSFEAIEAFLKI